MFFYLIQANFTNIVVVFFLYIFLFTGTTLSKSSLKIFISATLILSVLIAADMLDYYFASFDYVNNLRYITSAAGYTLRPAAILTILLISRRFTKKKLLLMFAPLAADFALSFSSIFTHMMFYFDASNKFHRGVMWFLPFAVSGIYLVLLLIMSFKKYRIGNKLETAVIVFIAVMSIVSSLMETLFGFNFLINGVGGVSIVFYYVFLSTQTYKRDAMTGALNRHSFVADADRLSKKKMIIVSIDLNNLKKINDSMGHDAGDAAIISVSNAIFTYLPSWYQLYRLGGDEFALLCPNAKPDAVDAVMKKTIAELDKKGYSIAWGMAEYMPSMDFNKVLAESDKKMYENKQMMKNTASE